MYFFVYIDFSFQTPNNFITSLSGSKRRVKGKLYFWANFLWLLVESAEIPRTTAFNFSNFGKLSFNVHASVVHPGVSSRG